MLTISSQKATYSLGLLTDASRARRVLVTMHERYIAAVGRPLEAHAPSCGRSTEELRRSIVCFEPTTATRQVDARKL